MSCIRYFCNLTGQTCLSVFKSRQSIIHSNFEGQAAWVIPDDVNRPGGKIFSRFNAMQINKRMSSLKDLPQPYIITVIWVNTAITIDEEIIFPKIVIIRTFWRSCDRKWQIKDLRLENPLRCNKRNPLTLKFKTLFK